MPQLLTAALDVAFFALVAVTLFAYLRHRTPIARDTVLVFASVGIVLAIPLVSDAGRQMGLWEALPRSVTISATVVFLAQPLLTLRLIHHFRERTAPVLTLFLLLFLASAGGYLYFTAVLGAPTMPLAMTLGVITYFTLGDVVAALYFMDEGRRRAGVSRVRLFLASAGSVLFGGAILVAGASAAVSPQLAGTPLPLETSTISILGQVLALLAGVAFLFAFVPSRFLRRVWQRNLAYDYLRDLVTDPHAEEQALLWDRLTAVSRQVTGARASAVGVGSYETGVEIVAADGDWRGGSPIGRRIEGADLRGIGPFDAIGHRLDSAGPTVLPLVRSSGSRRVGSIPIATDAANEGILLLFMARTPLFVEDDLLLLDVLNAHTARAVEREAVMSERSDLISRLQVANAGLEHASAAKGDFLAAMSHELRTPLHAIIGFSELLLTGPADQPQGVAPLRPAPPNVREFAGHIHGAGLHLLELINNVLDLAKVEAGKLDLQYQAFDISGLVHRTATTIRPIAARKRIVLDIPEPTGMSIEADASRVRQVVFNLLSNAIKFTPSGGRVQVTLAELDGEVQLTVEDSGPGVAPEDQRRIFEPFEQSSRPDAPRQEGTGLGLALTRQLVEGHGGRIELESGAGGGSRFTVFLPRAIGRAPAGALTDRAGTAPSGE
ncbi:MAG: HAMP domain-containing histidine kinase [Chloroflexi bacterium]|nr:HAMP domain-containing histidine kinase [Chloroflexota bacterium]